MGLGDYCQQHSNNQFRYKQVIIYLCSNIYINEN
jgi:hypothetical protein